MKKAGIMDLFYIMFAVTAIAITLLIGVYIKDKIFPQLEGIMGTGEHVHVLDTSARVFEATDTIILFLVFGTSIGSIIMAYYVPNNPAFLFFSIIIAVIMVFIAPVFHNLMRDFWAQPEYAVYAEGGGAEITFPVTTRIFMNLPIIFAGFAIFISLIQFAKSRSEF